MSKLTYMCTVFTQRLVYRWWNINTCCFYPNFFLIWTVFGRLLTSGSRILGVQLLQIVYKHKTQLPLLPVSMFTLYPATWVASNIDDVMRGISWGRVCCSSLSLSITSEVTSRNASSILALSTQSQYRDNTFITLRIFAVLYTMYCRISK